MRLRFTLFVTGADTTRSVTAKRRLDRLVERLDAEVDVEVVDVLDQPERAEQGRVFATPTLVRELPPPGQRVIGDLATPNEVATALGLEGLLRDDATMPDGETTT